MSKQAGGADNAAAKVTAKKNTPVKPKTAAAQPAAVRKGMAAKAGAATTGVTKAGVTKAGAAKARAAKPGASAKAAAAKAASAAKTKIADNVKSAVAKVATVKIAAAKSATKSATKPPQPRRAQKPPASKSPPTPPPQTPRARSWSRACSRSFSCAWSLSLSWAHALLSRLRAVPGVPRRLRNAVLVPAFSMLCVTCSIGAAYYIWALSHPLSIAQQKISIAPGDTLARIAAQLEGRGVITESHSLKLFARAGGLDKRIHTGEYEFPPGISLRQLLRNIASGRGRASLRVTIIEGWTFAQMRAHLRTADGLKQDSAGLGARDIMQMPGDADMHPEGMFAPDTYHYYAGESDLALYRAAFALQQKRLAAICRAAGLNARKCRQALILASIIEKESSDAGEQRRIAGVFHNRLRKGMRLEADPTVIYGIGAAYAGDITRAHLRTDTPYNTYRRRGLPPTPICLPGESALRAAAFPDKTDAYYFVAKGGGLHHFSVTLQQHNRAVREYRRKRG